MSLVNDMLRDLDQRRQSPNTNTTSQMITPAAAEQPKEGSRLGFAALVTLLSLAIGGFLGWPYLKPYLGMADKPKKQVLMPPEITVPPAPTKSAALEVAESEQSMEEQESLQEQSHSALSESKANTADVPGVSIDSWQKMGEGYRLILTSSQAFDYVVDTQSDQQIELQFNNLRMAGEMPPLPDSLIAAAHLMSLGKSRALLNLSTEIPAQFQVYPSKTSLGYLLNIELRPLAQKAAENTQPAVDPTTLAVSPDQTSISNSESKPIQTGNEPKAKPPARPVKPLVKKTKPLTLAQADRQQVQKASDLIGKQRVDEAESLLERYLTAEPKAIESRRLLVSIRISQGYLKGASQLIESGLGLRPEDSGLIKLKARILLMNGKAEDAVTLLKKAPPALKDDTEYHQLQAASLQSIGDHDQASKIYYQLLQHDSAQAAWWVGLAVSLESLQQVEKAREAYRNVLKIPAAAGSLKDFSRQRIAALIR